MRFSWAVLLIVLVTAGPANACRLALILALDVSGSVDPVEYQQQVTGLATALSHPEIQSLILADVDNPVTISVFEWSSQNHQFLILPWTRLDSSHALTSAIERIRAHRKVRAGLKTALGTAMAFGKALLNQQASCWQHTIDVSGDGRNNVGPSPRSVYQSGFEKIQVNALVIGNQKAARGEGPGIEPDDLFSYFETAVLHGPGAFALIANGYEDYARAMKKKLDRELRPPLLGAATRALDPPG